MDRRKFISTAAGLAATAAVGTAVVTTAATTPELLIPSLYSPPPFPMPIYAKFIGCTVSFDDILEMTTPGSVVTMNDCTLSEEAPFPPTDGHWTISHNPDNK